MIIESKYGGYGKIRLVERATDSIIAKIKNTTNRTLKVFVDDLEGWYSEPITVAPRSCHNLSTSDEDKGVFSMIKDGDFKAVYE